MGFFCIVLMTEREQRNLVRQNQAVGETEFICKLRDAAQLSFIKSFGQESAKKCDHEAIKILERETGVKACAAM